jgi:ABC-type Fe3+/spermidine/putrescine transport system ATPase subunit
MTNSGAFLDIKGAEKSFAAARVRRGVDIAPQRREFVLLLGPSMAFPADRTP